MSSNQPTISFSKSDHLPLENHNLSVYRRFGKRVFDILFATAVLAITLPFQALIALAVFLHDWRSPFFAQQRVGRRGRLFRVVKFRSMTVGSERGSSITASDDRRVTVIGKFLRRWKLDELPQFFNVLAGDMSIVGPRPDVPGYADRLVGADRAILELRPGITGPASLAFRHEEELLASVTDPQAYNDNVIYPQKVAINLRYLSECSLAGDLRYILATALPSSARDKSPDSDASSNTIS